MGELESFVRDFLEQAGGLVEPSAYGLYDVLLPEPVAERWQTAAYHRIAFGETNQEAVTQLGYNHPLVEQMVEEARASTASARAFVRGLRLTKGGLDELAAKNWPVLNGRVVPKAGATPARARCTYLRFNFKAAILSDEKQERLVSVLMDAHAGCQATEPARIEAQAAAQADDALKSLLDAPIRWQPPDGQPLSSPLEPRALAALLERARSAALCTLSAHLDQLHRRVGRFRELDQARLTGYYDGLERDLQLRLSRASRDRQPGLADKLAAVQAERTHKLADLAERYQVRLDLSLLNLLVIQQPKLVLPVVIENRTTQVTAFAIWDPLLHLLEPLPCAVCGLPIQRVALCFSGHLVHEECLAPTCVDCKRLFCQQCAQEVGECAVCHRPLCRHSRLVCGQCGRGTCREHQGMCHADGGEPVRLEEEQEQPVSPEPPEPLPTPPARQPPRPAAQLTPPARPARISRSARPAGVPKPQHMEVVVFPDDAVVACVFASRDRNIASRTWELDPAEGGICQSCKCQQDTCHGDGLVIYPAEAIPVEEQVLDLITHFRREYSLPARKVTFSRRHSFEGPDVPLPRFALFGIWKDQAALAEARTTFARRRRRRR